ncbi:MAG: hypothetical protein VKK04_05210 [Synechococcales bacterium]|nr:hypothetical protein [Synechococcales bacterium]
MLDQFHAYTNSSATAQSPEELTPIFAQKALDRCHVIIPDMPKPISAVVYEGQFYSYVKLFKDLESAQRGAKRLTEKGNKVILTRVRKGLVLWILELDARQTERALR